MNTYNFAVRTGIRAAVLIATLGLPLTSLRGQQPPAQPAPQTASPQIRKPNQPPTLRVSTGLVHLVATVADRHRRFVTDLGQNDFRVLEDGRPQKIQFFGRETDLPLRIGVLLDTSNSIRPRFRFEQDAAIDFLNNVIRRGKDLAFLMTFDNEPQFIQDYSDSLPDLTEAIQKQRAGGGTALLDAIYQAADKLSNPPLPEGPNTQLRRVIVVLSDGEDNLSDHAPSETSEMAERAEVAIYAISTSSDWLSPDEDVSRKLEKTTGDRILERFADQTGGRVFFPYKLDDLAESFQDIGNELRSQYFIAYAPENPAANGGYRKIQLEVDRKGLVVRTRKGYYASAVMPAPGGPPGQ